MSWFLPLQVEVGYVGRLLSRSGLGLQVSLGWDSLLCLVLGIFG